MWGCFASLESLSLNTMIMQWENIRRCNVFNPFFFLFFREQTREERKYLTFLEGRRDKKVIKSIYFTMIGLSSPLSCGGMEDASFDLGFWRNNGKKVLLTY